MTVNIAPPSESARPFRRWKWLGFGFLVAVLAAAVYWATTRPSPVQKNEPIQPWAQDAEVPDGPPWFRDVTNGSAVDFTYRNGEEADQFTILESVGGAWP
jgi:enediyne biosynthesis protein E4